MLHNHILNGLYNSYILDINGICYAWLVERAVSRDFSNATRYSRELKFSVDTCSFYSSYLIIVLGCWHTKISRVAWLGWCISANLNIIVKYSETLTLEWKLSRAITRSVYASLMQFRTRRKHSKVLEVSNIEFWIHNIY